MNWVLLKYGDFPQRILNQTEEHTAEEDEEPKKSTTSANEKNEKVFSFKRKVQEKEKEEII